MSVLQRDNVKKSLAKLKDDRERLARNRFLDRMLRKERNNRRKSKLDSLLSFHLQDLLDQVVNILNNK